MAIITDPLGICLGCYVELDYASDVCEPCWAEYVDACKASDAAADAAGEPTDLPF